MLSDLFKPLIEGSPLSVMMRGLVERLLNPEEMDQWFEQLAQEQYTRELLFSTVVSLMLEVVCSSRKAVNAAYQAMKEAIPVSIQAVYDKLQGIEPAVAAELVRYTAREGQAIMAAVEAAAPSFAGRGAGGGADRGRPSAPQRGGPPDGGYGIPGAALRRLGPGGSGCPGGTGRGAARGTIG